MLIGLFVQLKVCLQSIKSTERLFGQSDNKSVFMYAEERWVFMVKV